MSDEITIDAADVSLAYLLLRVTLGVNIFFHGAARLLGGSAHFVTAMVHDFDGTPLPAPLVHAFAYTLPWLEAIVGFLVLAGLFTRFALVVGALLILALTFGSTLRQDWQTAGLQLIYAAIYAALLAGIGANRYSADALFRRGPRALR